MERKTHGKVIVHHRLAIENFKISHQVRIFSTTQGKIYTTYIKGENFTPTKTPHCLIITFLHKITTYRNNRFREQPLLLYELLCLSELVRLKSLQHDMNPFIVLDDCGTSAAYRELAEFEHPQNKNKIGK